MNRIFGNIILLLTVLLFGCNAPNLTSSTPKKIIIASDFLEPKDSTLFKGFSKKSGIKVYILPMTVDSIINHYKNNPINTSFDAVLMSTTYNINKVAMSGVLHPCDEYEKHTKTDFVAPTKEWLILGIDPYVMAGVSVGQVTQYNDLTYGKMWKKQLSQVEMASFHASVLHQFGRNYRNKSLSWLEKLESQTKVTNDSIQTSSVYLTKLSYAIEDGVTYSFPNQSKKFGVFYDAIGFGIVKHSSKYLAVVDLMVYYTNLVHNQRFTNALHILPLVDPIGISSFDYQNSYPILFRCTPEEATKQFRDLDRIKNRLY